MLFASFLLLGVAAVAQALDKPNRYKMKLPQGLVVPNLALDESNFSPRDTDDLEQRDDCGSLSKSCNGGCIGPTDVCCDGGGVCALLETCQDDGTCCEISVGSDNCSSSDDDDSSSSETSCRDSEERCGTRCMPTGSVCCPDKLTYCPSGTSCKKDKCPFNDDDAVSRLSVSYGGMALFAMPALLAAM